MKFTLKRLEEMIDDAVNNERPTGIPFLDTKYDEQVGIIGHTNPYYRLFFEIAREFKPRRVVELGSWRAIAAAHFAYGNPDAEVITIDIHKDDKFSQQLTIEAANTIPNLTYINKWTWDASEEVGKNIDILFIDAWHRYDYATREKELYFPLLSDEALVICDDITDNGGMFEGMIRFWEEMDGAKILDTRPHVGVPMGFLHFKRKPAFRSNRYTPKK